MVWSTTQSAEYSQDRVEAQPERRERPERPNREKPSRPASHDKCPPKPAGRGIFEDSDTLIILALIMLLMRENADSKLIFALLLVIMQ